MSDAILSPREFRAQTIDDNRPAFELWKATSSLIEPAISSPRAIPGPYEAACDLLFIQAFKASCSVYILAVRGHEEDAATILRRLLEIVAQLGYLDQPVNSEERKSRAEAYLQQDPDRGRFWWGGNFRNLFGSLNLVASYDQDYRFLAQIAHAAARRVSLQVEGSVIQIRSTKGFTPLLVFSCRYLLGAARIWNECFALLEDKELERLSREGLSFSFP